VPDPGAGVANDGRAARDGGERRGGDAWLDELSILGETRIAEFYQERALAESVIAPEDFGLQPAKLGDIAGGDREGNAEIIRRILRNEDNGTKRDAVLLNAAAALFVAGKAVTISGDGRWRRIC